MAAAVVVGLVARMGEKELMGSGRQIGHGLMLMVAPTNVVVIGGLAVAEVGFDRYLGFMLPLLLVLGVVSARALFIAASV